MHLVRCVDDAWWIEDVYIKSLFGVPRGRWCSSGEMVFCVCSRLYHLYFYIGVINLFFFFFYWSCARTCNAVILCISAWNMQFLCIQLG